jgi:hypothetical protein
MPIWMRRFHLKKLQDYLEKKNEHEQKKIEEIKKMSSSQKGKEILKPNAKPSTGKMM